MNRGSPNPRVRLFGTNGIREVVGERLTAQFVTSVAAAIATVCPRGPPIVVGWDGRTSSESLARLATGTLTLGGHSVVEVGLLPTPAIQYNVRAIGAQLGVILTASHNPPEFNGIKCIAADGLEITREAEERIEAAVQGGETLTVPYDRVGDVREDRMGVHRYVEAILRQVDRERIASRKFRLVLDCGNGASVPTSPVLLRRLGCRPVTLNAQIDGTFPGHLSEPTEANLRDLVKTVEALGVDLGVAHDGDADRAVFVDGAGHYVPGEKVLTLLGREIVKANRGGVVVTPVTASQSLEDAVQAVGGEVVYTRVGSPSVTRAMVERKAVFGGEENGGLIFPLFQYARDGAMTLAAVLELLARAEQSLEELLDGLPRYFLLKEKVACPIELRGRVMDTLTEELSAGADRVVTLDGIKAYRDGGWVLVRPSGTEPLLRIFAEARSPDAARGLSQKVLRRVTEIVGSEGTPGTGAAREEPAKLRSRSPRPSKS
jgi:phosphomannomutase/phosphoglucomutase